MRQRFRNWLPAAYPRLTPDNRPQQLREEKRALTQALSETQARQAAQKEDAHRFLAEMVEAQAMCGAGPWAAGNVDAYAGASKPLREALQLREAGPVGDLSPVGAYGMYELLLQNVNWQREINYSWLEFTRWGIQQIILICRLYRIKNPIVRRLVDVCAQYVFARGVDVSTENDAANEVWKDFVRRNQKVVGHVALMELEKSKDSDGNLFFAFFTDQGTGECNVRMIDATEIEDIWCDPDDSDVPWFFKRSWTQRAHNPLTGSQTPKAMHVWYPAVNHEPTDRPAIIGGYPVMWDSPVHHRKVGHVGKWLFGCPRIYPMLDWAKEGRRYLEACASDAQSRAQFSFQVTTKGGQQAIEGIKQELGTQVGPGAPIWDTNPAAVAGSSFISGPGTALKAFNAGGGLDPEKCRQYKLQCCMVKGVPETFLGDVSTGNLATATSLDRPTEAMIASLQEEWIEDLIVIATYVLSKSLRAASGKLRESCGGSVVEIREAAYVRLPNGARKYVEAKSKTSTAIEVKVDFPAIREGDIPALIAATVEAMTLQNKGGQIVGIDEKEGIRALGYLVPGIKDPDEMVERMYPTEGKDKYDPVRAEDVLPPPIGKLKDQPGVPPAPGQVNAVVDKAEQKTTVESLKASARRLASALKLMEAESRADESD